MGTFTVGPPQKLTTIAQDLIDRGGRQFERAVCNAFNYLNLNSSMTETTEAESDIVAEAPYAEIPYFIVIECEAVQAGNQVGYDKLGQIRGNSHRYLDTRRQQLFGKGYKLVVGRPEFSANAKNMAEPDVGLLRVDVLIELLRKHGKYLYSQTQLQRVFQKVGEITGAQIGELERPYLRRLKIYSLIYISLLEDPYSERHDRRKGWTPLDRIVGAVLAYGNLFRIRELAEDEVLRLIRDLDNPFLRVVEIEGDKARLSSIPTPVLHTFSAFGKELSQNINYHVNTLRTLQHYEA